nr:hypothetical protein [Tanacetum cinerariifolium]
MDQSRVSKGLMHDHMDSLHAPGDQIGVTSYTGHAAKKSTIDYTSFGEFGMINLSIALSTADEGEGSVTSTGELNSFSIMNPSNAYGLDVEEGIWSAKVIGEINTSIAIPFGDFPSLNKVTSIRSKPTEFRSGNPTMSTRPTVSFNATSTSTATRENIHSKPNTYAGVAGSSDHSKDVNNFQHLVVEKLYEGINISILQKVIEKVKFHDVSLQVFEKDGISLIGTYIGKVVVASKVANTSNVKDTNDGFQQVVNKKRNKKTSSAESTKAGLSKHSNKGALVANKGTSNDTQKDKDVVDTGFMKMSNISTPNSFTALGEEEEEEVENFWDEFVNLNIYHTGASTPANTVPDV